MYFSELVVSEYKKLKTMYMIYYQLINNGFGSTKSFTMLLGT